MMHEDLHSNRQEAPALVHEVRGKWSQDAGQDVVLKMARLSHFQVDTDSLHYFGHSKLW